MAQGPLSRYRDLAVIEVATPMGNQRALPLRRLPTAPPSSAKKRRFVAVEPVDLIAKKEYGNEFLYWSILELNGVAFPDDFQTGQILFVAPLSQITRVSRE